MGFLAEVTEFLRSVVADAQSPEIKADRDGGDAVTAYHFAPPGDDSQPLAGDLAYLGRDDGAGKAQALGYQDPASEPKAGAGEKRIYARSGPGTVACEVWLKSDGTVQIASGETTIIVDADGVRLGSTDASQFVALAELVDAQLNALKDAISNAPTAPTDGGATFKAAIVAALATWPEPVAAEKVTAI